MKIFISFITAMPVLLSCNNSANPVNVNTTKETPVKQSFFPVTSFIKGELYEIRNKGINPLKFTTINNHTDSVWVKSEALNDVVKEFLHPEIDSVNLVSLFTEKSFLDQSIDAITFTYDATGLLPDTMPLRHWDVYIDPASGKVKRIYMVKEISKTKTMQLTWVRKQWCKITHIITDQNGTTSIEKEEKLTWDF